MSANPALIGSAQSYIDLLNQTSYNADTNTLASVGTSFNEKIQIGSSDSYISIDIDDLSFSLDGGINSPASGSDWFWHPVDSLEKVSAFATPGVHFTGSMTLEIGDQTGSFNLANTTLIPQEGVSFPTPIPGITATGKFGADFVGDITISSENKNKDYEFDFTVALKDKFSLSIGEGFTITPIQNNASATADSITGLTLDASIVPTVSASVGMEYDFPVVGGLNIASVNADLIPKLTFEIDPSSGNLIFDAIAGASADFLKVPPLFDGYHWTIAQESLYTDTVNLW